MAGGKSSRHEHDEETLTGIVDVLPEPGSLRLAEMQVTHDEQDGRQGQAAELPYRGPSHHGSHGDEAASRVLDLHMCHGVAAIEKESV